MVRSSRSSTRTDLVCAAVPALRDPPRRIGRLPPCQCRELDRVSVEIYAQVQTLKRLAADRGVTLQVEKLDVTNDGDRRKALGWDVEILVNNAGVGEGGATVDIPASNIRNQWEVNVTGPLLLTQGIAKQMVKRGAGRIVWVSSREGLNVNPFTRIYAASKHAVEAIAETMKLELQEFGIEVATVNPGPFLTGFNDRMFQTHESWEDDPAQRLFDYSQLNQPVTVPGSSPLRHLNDAGSVDHGHDGGALFDRQAHERSFHHQGGVHPRCRIADVVRVILQSGGGVRLVAAHSPRPPGFSASPRAPSRAGARGRAPSSPRHSTFPRAQFDPEAVYVTMTAVAAGEVDTYRNLEPKSMIEETKSLIEAPWRKKTTDGLGGRPDQIQHSYDMEPETPAS